MEERSFEELRPGFERAIRWLKSYSEHLVADVEGKKAIEFAIQGLTKYAEVVLGLRL